MNAVRMVYTPQQFTELTYDQLLPFSENASSMVGNTPIHEGIVIIDVPTSTNPFMTGDNLMDDV